MPVEPNIALNVGQGVPPPANPLSLIGQFAAARNALDSNAAINAHVEATRQGIAQSASDNIARKFGQFLALPPEMQTQAHARQLVDHTLAEGAITPEVAKTWHDKINGTGSQADLQNLAVRGILGAMGGQGALDNLFGRNTLRDTGQEIVTGTETSPAMRFLRPGTPGFAAAGGDVSTYPSRAQLAARTEGDVDPATGRLTVVPMSAVTPQSLAGPAGKAAWGDGRGGGLKVPSELRNPGAAPGSGPSGVTTPRLGPAEQSAMGATGAASAAGFQGVTDRARQARDQNALLASLLSDAAQRGRTGFGADQIKKIKSVALALGLPVDQAALAAAESMDKLAAVLANPQGAGSDARLAIMQAANPSAHNTPEGLSLIVRQLQGLSDHAQAMQALAARFPDKSKYADFEAGVGRALDPRAFMIERMTAEQKRDYFKHLTPRDQADVMRAHDFARANGLLGGANGR
jgi:hypothetical protein